MPLSDGMFAKKVLKASSPPAEAPMPTISGRVRPFDGAQGRSVLRSTARAAGSRFELPRLPVGFQFRVRSEEHTSELQSLMRHSYSVLCLKNKNNHSTVHELMHT